MSEPTFILELGILCTPMILILNFCNPRSEVLSHTLRVLAKSSHDFKYKDRHLENSGFVIAFKKKKSKKTNNVFEVETKIALDFFTTIP